MTYGELQQLAHTCPKGNTIVFTHTYGRGGLYAFTSLIDAGSILTRLVFQGESTIELGSIFGSHIDNLTFHSYADDRIITCHHIDMEDYL